LLAAGVILATAVSFVRVAVIIMVLRPAAATLIVPALLASALIAAACGTVPLLKRAEDATPSLAVPFGNPFGFWPVLGMALSIGLLIVAGQLIYATFGATGAITGAAAMGLFNVDAMTVSMLRLSASAVDANTMTYAILTGVAANTFGKVAIGSLIGRGVFARQITIVCVACVLAGWITMLVTMAVAR
jgi:uncharacterized membrane protein (DUF4010 family)